MLCRVPGGKSFLGCGTMTILPSSCLSFIWLPLWLTRTNPSFSSLLRTSLLFMSFLYATCATRSRKNTHIAHKILLVTGYEKRRFLEPPFLFVFYCAMERIADSIRRYPAIIIEARRIKPDIPPAMSQRKSLLESFLISRISCLISAMSL